MKPETPCGTYGFRFNDASHLPLCSLFAVGHELADHPNYFWDGLTRTDGPLLLFQYSVQGEGMIEVGDPRDFEDGNGDGNSEPGNGSNNITRIPAGRAFLIEIPSNHRYYYPSKSKTPWEFYFLLIRPRTALPMWREIVSLIGSVPYLDPDGLPIQRLKSIFNEAHNGKITDPYIASSFVYQFLIELRRAASDRYREEEHWPGAIREAVRFMNSHYHRMIGLEQLAEQLGLSKFHFLRTFTKYVGITPNDYVNRKRIEESIELLQSTDWSIETIASQVGYSSGSYYIKVFHKFTGQTPGSFRLGSHVLQYNRLFFD
ncbi:AraC family transcriptional regulator [Paenibacillus bouchesdurhonensis]|uniref:AraC family transcriptional regulator n=1 Tax=Paenibacillus bouchesdurhonensis TaxID=1870990 RepID=UPI000DA62D38|nr:AraC family transcriptional regulator [Paenibacillus bouchesdurhonensis]